MRAYFNYPPTAFFNKIVPKEKIYQQVKAKQKLKDRFIAQVERIRWQYKLASNTLNIPEGAGVKEIQIIEITLKGDECHTDILKALDCEVPHPILFHLLEPTGRLKVMGSYKRSHSVDGAKGVTEGQYFKSGWIMPSEAPKPLPMALNLDRLYEYIFQELLPVSPRYKENLLQQLERANMLIAKEKQYIKLDKQMRQQRQFNRQVELNKRLKILKDEINQLR